MMLKTKKPFILLLAALCAVALFSIAACGQSGDHSPREKMEVVSEPNVPTTPFYALFIGNDSRYQTSEDKKNEITDDAPCYSDTLMLARIDPVTFKIGLLSIPRDTYYVFNGEHEKINASHLNGPDATVKAAEELTGVQISYYFDEHFVDFYNMVQKLGGVTVDVPVALSWSDVVNGDKVTIEAGDDQTLGGAESLVFVRARKVYGVEGEACRQNNAREFVQKAIASAAHGSFGDAATCASVLMSVCKTNMDEPTLTALIQMFMEHADEIQFQAGTGPYSGGEYAEYGGKWVVPRDEETYAALINAMETDGDMTSIVAPAPMYHK